jgi:addiction module HigA family antidote
MTFAFENGDAILVDYQDYHREGFDVSRMYNPPHPGETLKEDVLPALGLKVTDAAAQLDVTRPALSRVLNGRAAVSPEMALRIEGWLGVENDGRAAAWSFCMASSRRPSRHRPRNYASPASD